jgi:hypothetical protein
MWLAQFVCAPQFFKTPKRLCGHRWNSRDRIPNMGLPEFHCNLPQTACGKKNFQSFTVICRKPHVAKKKLPEFHCNLPQTACGKKKTSRVSL